MTFQTNSGKTIQEAFEEFHRHNPYVYDLFKKQVRRAVLSGKSKISSKMIINFLRWELMFATKENTLFATPDGELKKFKINDAYHSRYVRLYVREFPEHKDLFEFRELRSA